MKKALFLVTILTLSVLSTACINNLAVQELNNKAAEYMKKGDYENAISRLKSSSDLDENIFETQYNLAIAYTENEDYDEAIATFEKALALKTSSPDVFYSRAVMYENYAKDLYAGNTKQQKEAQKEAEANAEEEGVELKQNLNDDGSYKPTDEEKAEIAKYYELSIADYEKYLETAVSARDNLEVKAKIEQIQGLVESINSGVDSN